VPIKRGGIVNCLQKYFWGVAGWGKTKSRKKQPRKQKKVTS